MHEIEIESGRHTLNISVEKNGNFAILISFDVGKMMAPRTLTFEGKAQDAARIAEAFASFLLAPVAVLEPPSPPPAAIEPDYGSFAAHPRSLNEHKSDKSRDAADWAPRDALISVLREIDEGLKVDSIAIGYSQIEGANSKSFFAIAGPNPIITLGTIEMMKAKLLNAYIAQWREEE
jgi:hypothetical protein